MCKKRREATFYKAGQESRNGRCNAAFWKSIQDSAVTYRHSVGVLRQPAKYDVHTLFLFIVLHLADASRTAVIDVAPFKIVEFLKTPQ